MVLDHLDHQSCYQLRRGKHSKNSWENMIRSEYHQLNLMIQTNLNSSMMNLWVVKNVRPNVPMKMCRLTLKVQLDPAIWIWPGQPLHFHGYIWARILYYFCVYLILIFFCKVIDAKVAKAFSSLALRLRNWDLRKVDHHSLRSIFPLPFERNEMIRQVAKKKVQAHHNQVIRHWFMTTLLMSWPNIKQWQRKMNQQSVNWLILILHQVRNHKLLLILSYE